MTSVSNGHGEPRIIPGVQYLRGIAAVLVVLKHSNGMMRYPQYFGQSPVGLSEVGAFGVTIFFVISGFIITVVSLQPDMTPRVSVANFFHRRFIRIVPFMWLCVIGYNLLSYLGTRRLELQPAFAAMILWPIGELKPNVLWTLRHELLFYLTFAVTMLASHKRRWLLCAWFAAPIAITVILPSINVIDVDSAPSWIQILFVVLRGSQTGANLQFCAGFLIGLAWLNRHSALNARLPYGPAAAVLATTLAAVFVEEVSVPNDLLQIFTWTVLSALVFCVGLWTKAATGLPHRVFTLLGNASYAIYLVHNPVLLILLEVSSKRTHLMPAPVYWLVFVGLAIAAGIVVHLYVETPLIAFLNRRSLAREKRPHQSRAKGPVLAKAEGQ